MENSHLMIAAFSGLVCIVGTSLGSYLVFYRRALTKGDHEIICGRTQNSVASKLALVHQKVEAIEKQGEELKESQQHVRKTVDQIMAKLANF